jgi:hypothetical protein
VFLSCLLLIIDRKLFLIMDFMSRRCLVVWMLCGGFDFLVVIAWFEFSEGLFFLF